MKIGYCYSPDKKEINENLDYLGAVGIKRKKNARGNSEAINRNWQL